MPFVKLGHADPAYPVLSSLMYVIAELGGLLALAGPGSYICSITSSSRLFDYE